MTPETWRFVRAERVQDPEGHPRTVRVYRTVFQVPAGVHGVLEAVGRTRAVLDDGTPLTDLGGGRYRALATGSELKVIGPDAP